MASYRVPAELHQRSQRVEGVLLVITMTGAVLGGARLGRGQSLRTPASCWNRGSECRDLADHVLAYQAVAPRVAYLALPLWVVFLRRGEPTSEEHDGGDGRCTVPALNAWTIVEIAQLNAPKFIRW